jgi:hypothetical protein
MTTQYTPILKLALPVQGELSGTWGDVVNDNITSMVEQAIAGLSVVNTWTTNSHVLTTANGTTAESRAAMLSLTDSGTALTGAGSVICPALSKVYIVKNGTAQVITVKTAAGSGIAVPVGKTMLVYCDGTNVLEAVDHIVTLSAGTLTITGLTTFASLKGTGAVTVTNILDEDNMASDSATALATQQSIKAYVDSQVGTVDTLSEILAIGNTTGATDIDVDGAQKVQFRDAAIYINSSVDGQLDIVADTEIQIAATTIDINGAIVASGDISAASLDISGNVDIDGITNLDVVDIDGAVQIDAALTVGIDDTGYDVKFYGATGGAYMLWDESADDLILAGAAGLSVAGAGNVGIGTSSPSSATWSNFLQVEATYPGVVYNSTAGGSNYKFSTGVDDDKWLIRDETAAATRLIVDASGNVGIGTSSPANKLEVFHGTVGTGNSLNNALALRYNSTTLYGQHYMDGNGFYHIRADAQGVAGGNLILGGDSSVQLWTGTTPEARLTIASTGAATFSGAASATGLTATNSGLTLQTASVTKSSLAVAASANQGINGTAIGDVYHWTTGGKILWSTNNGTTAHMTLDASGNVGIGVVPSAWGSYYSTINAGSAGNLSFFTGQTNAPVVNVGVNLYNDNTNFRYAATGAASFYQQYVGQHRWYNVASGGVGDIATPVQAMTLDASGDLTTTGAATFGGNVTGKNATFVTTTAASLISIGDTAAGTYSLLRMYGGSGKYNFQVGVQNNVNNAFEITPSTAVGGTTFTTPALLIDGTTGAATFGGAVDSKGQMIIRRTVSSNEQLRLASEDGIVSITAYNGVNTDRVAIHFVQDTTGTDYTPMVIDASGSVGIGVVPIAHHYKSLEIGNAGSQITGRTEADTYFMSGLYWSSSSTIKYAVSAVPVGYYNITNGAHSWNNSAAGTAGNDATINTAMTLDASGNLLVGASSTGEAHILQSSGASKLTLSVTNANATTPYGQKINFSAAAPNDATYYFLTCADTSATRATIRSNGGLANYSANDANLSDEREKNQFGLLGSTTACLREWEIVKYLYKDEDQTLDPKYGVIAQQVAPHCPEVITDWVKVKGVDEVLWTDEDELPEGVAVGDVKTAAVQQVDRIGVKEQQMFWMLVKSHQEALDTIDALTARIEALEGAK